MNADDNVCADAPYEADRSLVRVGCPVCGSWASRLERTIDSWRLERCVGCGHVYVNPQPPESLLQEFYAVRDEEELTAFYARRMNSGILSEYRASLAEIERLLPGRGSLLDIGCGAGYFVEEAQRIGWAAEGVDLGEWVRFAAAQRGLLGIRVGTVDQLDIPDGSYDVVCASEVLEHLATPRSELARWRRLVRPGGLLYLTVPNYDVLSIRLGRDDFVSNKPPQHLNYFRPRVLRRLLLETGWAPERVFTRGGLKLNTLLGGTRNETPLDIRERSPARSEPARETGKAVNPASASRRTLLKRVAHPLVDALLYRWAKVGMSLLAIARRV